MHSYFQCILSFIFSFCILFFHSSLQLLYSCFHTHHTSHLSLHLSQVRCGRTEVCLAILPIRFSALSLPTLMHTPSTSLTPSTFVPSSAPWPTQTPSMRVAVNVCMYVCEFVHSYDFQSSLAMARMLPELSPPHLTSPPCTQHRFCQILGPYRMSLPFYNSRTAFPDMAENCPRGSPPDYPKPEGC